MGLVGFPSVGKSTLLTKLTGTMSEVRLHRAMTAALCMATALNGCQALQSYSQKLSKCSVSYRYSACSPSPSPLPRVVGGSPHCWLDLHLMNGCGFLF